ncbi:MAG TPA: sigma-70 family RNA polymerase sigma factor [Bacteroidia bacterium]|nr:sigma-70 family RNA polymerase sigma factor [Bacteroidia bacterium]
MTDELEHWIHNARKGNPEAFGPVVRRFERPLRVWLATLAPPGIDVDDIAQRSFIVAYNRLSDYLAGTDFPAWLFTIAKFQLLTETTRLRRVADYHTRYAPDLLCRELERRQALPPERTLERMEHLGACLEQLDARMREFLVWRYEEEIPLEAMARQCGRSVPAVKKVLWRLRMALRDCIQARMAATE